MFVSFGGTIIEEDDIIEDDNILSRSTNGDEPSPPETSSPKPDDKDKGLMVERPYLNLLKSIPGYLFNFEKDLPFIRDLLVDFPALNLEMEIKDWKTWLLDKKLKGRINYRSRLRRWVKNSIRYKEKDNEKHPVRGGKPDDQGVRPGRKGFDLPSRYPVDAGGIDNGKA